MSIRPTATHRPAALALALAVLGLPLAQAAEESLSPVVVTATRQPMRANELLSDVTVIERAEIERAGQSTLEELLARQPGIEYTANGGAGTNSSLFIRGANSNHTLLLIDGQRVGSVSSGIADFSRLPLSQIERIEIVRGPASSLYGADAIGGVIQIFTRRGEGPMRFNASAGYGTHGTADVSAGVSGGTELLSYSLQAAHYETRGISSLRNPGNANYNADRDRFRNQSASGQIALRPAPGHEIGLSFLSTQGLSHYDGGPGSDPSNDQSVGSISLYSRNRLSEDWTSTLRLGRSTDDATNRTDGIADSVYHTDQDQISWQNDIRLPLGRALIAAEYLRQQLTGSSELPVDSRNIRSLLAGWNGALGKHRLQFNVRRDDNSQFGGKTTGQAGYGYQLTPAWRVHASYGTAFKAPTFNNLYFPLTCYGQWGCFGGNPDLKPETARNAEAGLAWEQGSRRASLVHFRNRVSNLIDATLPIPMNVSQATLSGTTLSYAASAGAFSGGLTLDLMRARDDLTGRRLPRRADEQLKAHLAYARGPLTVGGELKLVGERFDNAANTRLLGGYGLLDLYADYRLAAGWALFARANNLFDKEYELARDYGTPGRTLFVGLRYQPK